MCGILGIISQDPKSDLANLDTRGIKNRGPDNVGQYVDRNVAFFHTRLAVIDNKETSNQPLISSDQNIILICNGEIYNHQELRKEAYFDYSRSSDCEAIISCYSRKGIEGFKELKGMFSFGLYDKKKNRVIIYRDAIGKKPLFFYQSKDIFIFSSTVSAIKDNLPHSVNIEEEAMASFLKDGYVRPDISFYKNIHPLLPGNLMEIEVVTGLVLNQYIVPDSTCYDSFDYSEQEIMRETKKLLTQSLKRRMFGIERPVLLFSGGIDSTVLAKEMTTLKEKQLNCIFLKPLILFTYDEIYARYATKRLNVKYLTVDIQWKDLKKNIDAALSLLDQPLALYSYFFLTHLTRKAKEFGNVLFLGEGGDEVFYGYSDCLSWFSNGDSAERSQSYSVGPKPSSELSGWGRRQVTTELLGHSFVKVDKATAEQQMEARCPYLDWDLMNFVRSIPLQFFKERKITKIILKNMLDDFPRWFVNRNKVGFAFNFRYLTIPFYKCLYDQIKFKELKKFGISVSRTSFSPKHFFYFFDQYWKFFVLSKFL